MHYIKRYSELAPGDRIIVRFGSHGTQRAIVSHIARTGTVYVRKERANSGRWTQPVAIRAGELKAAPLTER